METEKSADRVRAEKEAMDQSGHSELLADLRVNRQQGDVQNQQQGKKIFQSTKKKEEVLLENPSNK